MSRPGTLKHILERARDSTYLYMGWGPCTYVNNHRPALPCPVSSRMRTDLAPCGPNPFFTLHLRWCAVDSAVKVGRTDFTADELVDNVMAVRS